MDILKIIADIIQNELSLSSGQVMIYNQSYKIPTTPGLYVVVGNLGGKAIGSNSEVTDEATGISETQTLSMLKIVQIDLMSIDSSARDNEADVIMALQSDYAQKTMEQNKIKIARIPSQFNDISEVEGHAMMTRLSCALNILALYTKNKAIDYYDVFTDVVPPGRTVEV